MRAVTRAFGALLVVAAAASCGSPCGPGEVDVDFVVDGDTFQDLSGARYRLLLIDAPETTGGKNDCGGQQAKSALAGLLEGRRVQLRYDEASCTDRFDRSLVYVTVDGTDVNAKLVEDGLACVLHIPPAGDSRFEEFDALEFAARNQRKGVWGTCEEVTCD